MTLGIDLSSMPPDTSACLLEWHAGQARVLRLENACDDDLLDELHVEADATGLDAPLGWPLAFREAVGSWQTTAWNPETRDRMSFRETDEFVRRQFGLRPLSVSTDRISLPAMRAMAFLKRHGIGDASGAERVFEVYPAGALKIWDLPHKGYKKDPEGLGVRRELLAEILEKIPISGADVCLASGHAFDALIAAIVTHEALRGRTVGPPTENSKTEGWIHLPMGWPTGGKKFQ
ncbi:MAG: DUF429 domain-containing protein [Terrimicrobiaceae bacterium]